MSEKGDIEGLEPCRINGQKGGGRGEGVSERGKGELKFSPPFTQ